MKKTARFVYLLFILLLLFPLGACSQSSEKPLSKPFAQPSLTFVPEATSEPTKSTSNTAPVLTPTKLSPTTTQVLTPTALFTADKYLVPATYPHDSSAFTEGLYFEEGFLYESTGLYGHSTVRKVELSSGRIVQEISLPDDVFGEGLTVVGDKIYQLTWKENVGFIYEKSTFQKLGEFYYPSEGWGLAFDGVHLLMSDGTSTLHFLDLQDFHEVKTINVSHDGKPVKNINELEYIKGEIFANIWKTTYIVRIDPQSGDVIEEIDFKDLIPLLDNTKPIDVLNGIAYDPSNDRLFVTGKFWPKLFEIELTSK